MARKPEGELRRGWTTGACATAATKAAYTALVTGQFPDPVTIRLPRGETPAFALTRESIGDNEAWASVTKDAGDDPDVTHGAEIRSTVRWSPEMDAVSFKAGDGVGVVNKREAWSSSKGNNDFNSKDSCILSASPGGSKLLRTKVVTHTDGQTPI